MKKLILSSFALVALLASCEDEDDAPVVVEACSESATDGSLNYTAGAVVDISGWTWKDATLDIAGDTMEISGEVTEDTTLDGDYILTDAYVVKSGVTLTIEAGTQIQANIGEGAASSVYIAVEAGATININGTADNPVIMSTEAGTRSGWGGLTVAGNAFTTAYEGAAVTAEVSGITYGSADTSNNTESSGSIEYLVIRGTGAQIDANSQYNGISFFGVGSGTTVENIAVINGGDDGVEFFGGTVEATNLYLLDNQDDSVDWTEGWSGGVTNVYIEHTDADFSTVIEGDNINFDPTFTNLTAVSSVGGTGLQFKKASGASITGLNLSGYDLEFDIKNTDQFVACNVTIDGEVVSTTEITEEEVEVETEG